MKRPRAVPGSWIDVSRDCPPDVRRTGRSKVRIPSHGADAAPSSSNGHIPPSRASAPRSLEDRASIPNRGRGAAGHAVPVADRAGCPAAVRRKRREVAAARVRVHPPDHAGPADPSHRRGPTAGAGTPPARRSSLPAARRIGRTRVAPMEARRGPIGRRHRTDEQGPPHRAPHPRPRASHHRRRQGGRPVLRGDPRVRRRRQGEDASSTTSSPGTAWPRPAAATSARASRSRSRAGSRPAPGTTTRARATGRRRSSRAASRCSPAGARRTTRPRRRPTALEAQAIAAGVAPDAAEPVADDAGFSVTPGGDEDDEEDELLEEAVAA